MDTLYRQMHKWMATPFVWGESDCLLSVADYAVALGYADPASHLRGMYDSATSCHRLTGWLKDPVKVMQDCAGRIGLDRTQTPVRGDVGVVRVRSGRSVRTAGAVFLGKNWGIHGEDGVIIGPVDEVLAAWRIDRA